MEFDWFSLFSTLLLFLIIFSPLLFSKKNKNSTEEIGWQGVFKSKWFGITLIFLLPYLYFSFLNVVFAIILSTIISFVTSLIANWRLLLKRSSNECD
ncbi:hypothetical protein LGQ02_10565 [Bacillus shivajii]|uniref:hypothetical protein n=1 Tax=Bacillus shivajii TaxID=1983719 RepID=UPI001CFC0DB8|nr:hypothetical protein [Bacillus shivajii]UCZ55128.1 hypothetical protein LGQ02_10565 [Bacillus shivajii]